jgi:hypothetical protein
MQMRTLAATALCVGLLQTSVVPPAAATTTAAADRRIWMSVGDRRFAVTLADTEADMPDLNGNEKHAKLPKPLPQSAVKPGTIRNGDLMLWGADTLVVFYLTFDSAYSYTRLGRIEEAAALPQVLGRGQVRIGFSKE